MTTFYTIREATPADAEAILAHSDEIANEPDNGITRGPGENMSLEEERTYLANSLNTDNAIFLIAITESGEVIGVLAFNGGRRRATRHAGDFGVSVSRAWRDQGVGTALIRHMMAWAANGGIITRIGLTVMTHNERAIHVYQKLGFEIEGRMRAALFKEGRYIDVYAMSRLLMDAPTPTEA